MRGRRRRRHPAAPAAPEEHPPDRVLGEVLLRRLHVEIEDRRDVEREELGHQEAADDREAERAARGGARAGAERDRQRPEQRLGSACIDLKTLTRP